ncbi:hypothetical protein DUI87_08244 [Hirundo rustica rustica]|uniref:Uncharacterized protein n=1 Tax=Hirundo rustica rustica TaxID=333673 RepID=A0A3M0L9W7_HIRRU|nr:hypothetical protein DUI87_08244 [Hirundo rustica rustica]
MANLTIYPIYVRSRMKDRDMTYDGMVLLACQPMVMFSAPLVILTADLWTFSSWSVSLLNHESVTVRLTDCGRFWGEVKAKVEGLSDGADAGAGPAVSGVQPVPSRVPASDPVRPTGQDMAGAAASSKGLQTFPVLQGTAHNTLAWQALTELCDAVGKYGLGSAKVMQVLHYINASLLMPFDIRSLARALFPPLEYDFFEHKWTQLAVRAVERNRTLGPGDPRHKVNTDMLMGTGNYTRANGQAGFEPLVQEQCQQTGMAALVQTIQLAAPQESFATIVQGVDEPFLRFAGQLTAAVEKQVSDLRQGSSCFSSLLEPTAMLFARGKLRRFLGIRPCRRWLRPVRG